MSPRRLRPASLLLMLAIAAPASAQDDPGAQALADMLPQGFDQVVYKGLVGKVLDGIPMDPVQRVGLQRTNAVVSNTMFGRSMAVWLGLSNPVMLLGGLVWGMWAASNIKPAEADTTLAAEPVPSGGDAVARERLLALLAPSAAAGDAPAESAPEPVLLSLLSDEDSGAAASAPSRVVKVWLPQRVPTLPR